MSILSIVIFVLIFSFLVIVHELGHFWAARLSGVKVEEFGLGLPPRVWGKKVKGTLYSLNGIPFGGFVKLKGESDGSTGSDSLVNKSYPQKFLIMAGGVLMNFLTAYLVLCIGMWLGMPPLATSPDDLGLENVESQVLVFDTQEDLPAARAGVMPGDVIVMVGETEIGSVEDLQSAVQGQNEVLVVVERQGETEELLVGTVEVEGNTVIGVAAEAVAERVNYPAASVPIIAARDFGNIFYQIAIAIGDFAGRLFTTGSISSDVAGPIGIAQITAHAVELGLLPVLQLVVFLSVNLGLINLFPFPALDGGRILFMLVEMAVGKKRVPAHLENVIHNFGFLLLLVLIVVVTYRDIVRILG